MALAVEVAKISQVGQLEGFLSTVHSMDMLVDESISKPLASFSQYLSKNAIIEEKKSNRMLLRLLGWYTDPITGDELCLPHVGGCTLDDITFLLGQLWSSRKDFLYAAAWASNLFPKWGGLLFALHYALAHHHRFVRARGET